jgi:hypothetical protein
MAKQIFIKAYDSAGTFKKVIQDASFSGFTKNINGGLGNLTLKLARTIDNFNSSGDVTLGNIIKIYISDEDALNVLIYSGTVEEQRFNLDESGENVEIVCYGFINRLKNDILKTGNYTMLETDTSVILQEGTTPTAVAELSNIIRKIVDFWNVANPEALISYNINGVDSIVDCSTAMTYLFKAVTYYDAIESCRKVSPQYWYWYLDVNNVMNFNVSSQTVPTHTFTIGRNIKSIKIEKTLQETSNVLHLVDTSANYYYRKYSDANSISLYGRRTTVISEDGWRDTATMDSYGNSFINERKNPFIKIEMEIYDNNDNSDGYDIESINPGDTCTVVNLDNSQNIIGQSMVITQVDWTPDTVKIIVSFNKFDLDKYLTDLSTKVEYESLPASGTMDMNYNEVS